MSKKKTKTKNQVEEEVETKEVELVDETEEISAEAEGEDAENTLAALESQLREMEDRFLRARAEVENYRKRMQRESAEIREYTKVNTIQEFFSVLDHFQMAMDHVEQTPDFNTLKQGMTMILGEFRRTFENLGVQTVDATGAEFNPNEHEAVAQEPSDEVPRDHVLRQWKCGYKLGDRLLRPASVIVSSGPAAEDNDDDDDGKKPKKTESGA